jgi:hypothetical protein
MISKGVKGSDPSQSVKDALILHLIVGDNCIAWIEE